MNHTDARWGVGKTEWSDRREHRTDAFVCGCQT